MSNQCKYMPDKVINHFLVGLGWLGSIEHHAGYRDRATIPVSVSEKDQGELFPEHPGFEFAGADLVIRGHGKVEIVLVANYSAPNGKTVKERFAFTKEQRDYFLDEAFPCNIYLCDEGAGKIMLCAVAGEYDDARKEADRVFAIEVSRTDYEGRKERRVFNPDSIVIVDKTDGDYFEERYLLAEYETVDEEEKREREESEESCEKWRKNRLARDIRPHYRNNADDEARLMEEYD